MRSALRATPRARLVGWLTPVLVVALAVGVVWWTGDGQQRRRAVAGLGDLPGVATAQVSADDDRGAFVVMDGDATYGEVTDVLRRAVPVLESDDYELATFQVRLGAAYTDVSGLDVGDGGDAATRAELMVGLADLATGAAFVPAGGPVLLRGGGDDPSQHLAFDQVLDALERLADADLPVPDGLWGDGLLRLSEIDVPPGVLAQALRPLGDLLDDDVDPEAVTGGLANLTVPDDLGRASTRALLRDTADRLADVRADGRPVIGRLYAETTDYREDGVGVRVG